MLAADDVQHLLHVGFKLVETPDDVQTGHPVELGQVAVKSIFGGIGGDGVLQQVGLEIPIEGRAVLAQRGVDPVFRIKKDLAIRLPHPI